MPWPTKTNGNFLRLKDGDTITIQLMASEPEIKFQHYNGKSFDDCLGEGCEHCLEGVRRDTKCKMPVLDLLDHKEKVLEGTAALFNSIKTVLDMVNGGKGSSLMIKATGQKSERRYTVLPAGAVPPAIGAKVGDAQDDEDPFSKP